MKWVLYRWPKVNQWVVVKRLMADGSYDIGLGYRKNPAGDKNNPYFVVPIGDGERPPAPVWRVIGWFPIPTDPPDEDMVNNELLAYPHWKEPVD